MPLRLGQEPKAERPQMRAPRNASDPPYNHTQTNRGGPPAWRSTAGPPRQKH